MKVGILSKRETGLSVKIKHYLTKKGYFVKLFTFENLCIDHSLLECDFYILKSKALLFIYAGYYLQEHNIPVIPSPEISYQHKNRINSHLLIQRANLLAPEYFLGSAKKLKNDLNTQDFPLIQKPIMSSGNTGIKLIKNVKKLNLRSNELIYLEKYIEGNHYNACFMGDNICVLEKPPIVKDYEKTKEIGLTEEFIDIVNKWKKIFNGKLLFGHIDLVRERDTNQFYIVDVGTFPEFKIWNCSIDPLSDLCELIFSQS